MDLVCKAAAKRGLLKATGALAAPVRFFLAGRGAALRNGCPRLYMKVSALA